MCFVAALRVFCKHRSRNSVMLYSVCGSDFSLCVPQLAIDVKNTIIFAFSRFREVKVCTYMCGPIWKQSSVEMCHRDLLVCVVIFQNLRGPRGIVCFKSTDTLISRRILSMLLFSQLPWDTQFPGVRSILNRSMMSLVLFEIYHSAVCLAETFLGWLFEH